MQVATVGISPGSTSVFGQKNVHLADQPWSLRGIIQEWEGKGVLLRRLDLKEKYET